MNGRRKSTCLDMTDDDSSPVVREGETEIGEKLIKNNLDTTEGIPCKRGRGRPRKNDSGSVNSPSSIISGKKGFRGWKSMGSESSSNSSSSSEWDEADLIFEKRLRSKRIMKRKLQSAARHASSSGEEESEMDAVIRVIGSGSERAFQRRNRSQSLSQKLTQRSLRTKSVESKSLLSEEDKLMRKRSRSVVSSNQLRNSVLRRTSVDSISFSAKRGRSRTRRRMSVSDSNEPKQRKLSGRTKSVGPSIASESEENESNVERSRSKSRKVLNSRERNTSMESSAIEMDSDVKRDSLGLQRSRSNSQNSRASDKESNDLTLDCSQGSIDNLQEDEQVSRRRQTRTRSRSKSEIRKREDSSEPSLKKSKLSLKKPLQKIMGDKDIFCWQCHRTGTSTLTCQICPRIYHKRCAKIETEPETWVCIECNAGMKAGSFQGRSEAMKSITQEKFNQLLKFVLERIYSHEGSDYFKCSVDLSMYPNYKDFVIHPMDLSLMEKNINNSKYQSTESFLADLKWLTHNSYIFNSPYSELTAYARGIIKIAKQECEEIETCPNCYFHYHTMEDDTWFVEPCKKPHLIVWAKLRGFPHWPAKIMKMSDEMVDVRFFGDHNRAWLTPESCYLFSKSSPFLTKTGDQRGYSDSIKEVFIHIKHLQDKYGVFRFSPARVRYSHPDHDRMLYDMLPMLDPKYKIDNKQNPTNCKTVSAYSSKEKKENNEAHPSTLSTTDAMQDEIKKNKEEVNVTLKSKPSPEDGIIDNSKLAIKINPPSPVHGKSNTIMVTSKNPITYDNTTFCKVHVKKSPLMNGSVKGQELTKPRIIVLKKVNDQLLLCNKKNVHENISGINKPSDSSESINVGNSKGQELATVAVKDEELSSADNKILPRDLLRGKEPRVILTKISSKYDFNPNERGTSESACYAVECSNEIKPQESRPECSSDNIGEIVNCIVEKSSTAEPCDRSDSVDCIPTENGEEVQQSTTEPALAPNQIRLKVKPSTELLSSEALKRHSSSENVKSSERVIETRSEVCVEGASTVADSLPSNKDNNACQNNTSQAASAIEVINLCEDDDKVEPPLKDHVSVVIERVVNGNESVPIDSFLLKRITVKPVNQTKDSDTESENITDADIPDDDSICENGSSATDTNMNEFLNDDVNDISVWSKEPFVENSTITESMTDLFSSIEKAKDLELCKNLVIKIKKLSFLQRMEMKSCYEKMRNEVADVCNTLNFQRENLIKRRNEFESNIKKTKMTQWCSLCFKEANFYCCWGTSYCSSECQLKDWGKHQEHCKQSDQQDNEVRVTPSNKVLLPPSVTLNKVSPNTIRISTPTSNRPLTITKTQSPNSLLKKSSTNPTNVQLVNQTDAQPIYPKTVCQTVLVPREGFSTVPSFVKQPTILTKRPDNIKTLPMSSSSPIFLNNKNQIFKLVPGNIANQTTDSDNIQNRIVIRKDQLKNSDRNYYKLPITSLSSPSLAKNNVIQFTSPYIVRSVNPETSTNNSNFLVVKPKTKIQIDSIKTLSISQPSAKAS